MPAKKAQNRLMPSIFKIITGVKAGVFYIYITNKIHFSDNITVAGDIASSGDTILNSWKDKVCSGKACSACKDNY